MKKLQDMTLKEKIGQLVFAGFHGLEYNDQIKSLIETYKLGNIILFTRNIDTIEQLHSLNKRLYQEIMNQSNVIPFISIDQEGGMVTRIMKEATFCPGNMTIGATNPKNAYLIGQVVGTELRSLGINMNLAPSLDVNNNPLNPVIGVRSYSDDPNIVSEYGLEYIKGLQEKGIIATAKHFPGHGDTASDSHYSLPIVPHDKVRLNNIELVPFKKAIASGVDAIMSAHVFFTAYEQGNLPATLSKRVMTDLLRNDLGFKGLIVSDCMEMKAIDDTYTAPVGALMGLLAGLDMVFVSQTYQKQVDTLNLIEKAVLDGRFPMEYLDSKVERILKFKEKVYPIMVEYFLNTLFEEKYPIITDPISKKLASDIVDSSLTLVRGKEFYPNKKTLVIATEPFATTIVEDELSTRSIIDAIKLEKLDVDTIKIKVNVEDLEIERIIDKARFYPQVVVFTYNANSNKSQAKLVNKLHYIVEDLFVISTRNPYDLLAFKQIKNYLCLYEYTPNSVKTVVKYLSKKLSPTGKLPIKLETKIKIGASVYVGLNDYPLESNLKYLELLKSKNIEMVFISAHIPEMNANFKEELSIVINKANELGIKVVLDISKPMFENFEVPKIYSLRLDYGFSNDEIIELIRQYDFFIELNASTLTQEQLQYFIYKGVELNRIRVSHNFYPKLHTGLSQNALERRNRLFHNYGLQIMAYIPSFNGRRMPLYEGLPTVEDHRNLVLEAALSEMKTLGVDEVFFGDAYASANELERAVNFDFSVKNIPILINPTLTHLERSLLEKVHRNRLDQSVSFVRSSTRIIDEVINPFNTIERQVGDVTIDNVKFARYQGEVSIILEKMSKDDRVNVVAKVVASKYLIENIQPGEKFKFIIIGEK